MYLYINNLCQQKWRLSLPIYNIYKKKALISLDVFSLIFVHIFNILHLIYNTKKYRVSIHNELFINKYMYILII